MEPVLAKEVPLGPGYVYQVKWDGVRMLAFIDQGEVILQNKRGRLKTKTFPELYCLGNISKGLAILDGEIVALRNGKPDFSQILRRNFLEQPGPGAPPISYVIFDILCIEGRDLRREPLSLRQEVLESIKFPPGPVSVIENFTQGEKLYTITGANGWEGIVAKEISSPYHGGKSSKWQKIKHLQREKFWIVGYTSNQGNLASLLLAQDFGEGLKFCGGAASGLSQKNKRDLQTLLHPLLIAKGIPVPVAYKQSNWVRPLLQVEVEFMEWTETFTLRAPVVKLLFLEEREFALS
jgi:bifunctional non-homologous end joining protein LigD